MRDTFLVAGPDFFIVSIFLPEFFLKVPRYCRLECFDPVLNTCVIEKDCKLIHILNEGLLSFLSILDRYTIEDLIAPKVLLRNSLKIKD